LIEHKTKKWTAIIEFEKDGNYFTAWVTEDNLKDFKKSLSEKIKYLKKNGNRIITCGVDYETHKFFEMNLATFEFR
jgi:hypothetical protein